MKVVVITGCSSGLGRALARKFSKTKTFAGQPSSFRVYATARNLQSIEDLKGEGIDVIQLDVTDGQSIQQAVDRVLREAGRIDVLVCNAGIARLGPLVELDTEVLDAVLTTNMYGS